MRRDRLGTPIAVIVLAAALVLLVTLLMRPGLSPYLAVDELVTRKDELRDVEMRLAGFLVAPVEQGADRQFRFRVETRGASLPVVLTDRMPPGLAAGTEILLDGRLGSNDTFYAYRLLTQCSSRDRVRLRQPAGEVE